MSQAQLKREEAERELRDSCSKLGRQLELAQQVRDCLGSEFTLNVNTNRGICAIILAHL